MTCACINKVSDGGLKLNSSRFLKMHGSELGKMDLLSCCLVAMALANAVNYWFSLSGCIFYVPCVQLLLQSLFKSPKNYMPVSLTENNTSSIYSPGFET